MWIAKDKCGQIHLFENYSILNEYTKRWVGNPSMRILNYSTRSPYININWETPVEIELASKKAYGEIINEAILYRDILRKHNLLP